MMLFKTERYRKAIKMITSTACSLLHLIRAMLISHKLQKRLLSSKSYVYVRKGFSCTLHHHGSSPSAPSSPLKKLGSFSEPGLITRLCSTVISMNSPSIAIVRFFASTHKASNRNLSPFSQTVPVNDGAAFSSTVLSNSRLGHHLSCIFLVSISEPDCDNIDVYRLGGSGSWCRSFQH